MADIKTSVHGREVWIGFKSELILNKASNGGQTMLGLYEDKIITSAQVLALFTTPITVIAAPGAGLAIVPLRMQLYKPAGTAYAAVAAGEDLVLKYTNASGAQCSGVVEATGFMDQATAQTRMVGMPGATGSTAGDYAPVANAAVVLHLLTGEITTGTSDLIARVWYDVITTTLPTA
jgi:hypothetical protein